MKIGTRVTPTSKTGSKYYNQKLHIHSVQGNRVDLSLNGEVVIYGMDISDIRRK